MSEVARRLDENTAHDRRAALTVRSLRHAGYTLDEARAYFLAVVLSGRRFYGDQADADAWVVWHDDQFQRWWDERLTEEQ